MKEPKITCDPDDEMGTIEFFVDGKTFKTWVYDDDYEASFVEFKDVFMAGFNYFKDMNT
jgi:hypothetical protein